MTNDSLEFKLAESRLQHLENEMDPIMAAHHEAKACGQCEKYIELCILVYQAIAGAEKTMRQADQEGIAEYGDAQHASIKLVYERWLVLGEILATDAREFSKSGYNVDRKDEFMQCYEAVLDWLDRNEWQASARALARERFEQEESDEVAAPGGNISP